MNSKPKIVFFEDMTLEENIAYMKKHKLRYPTFEEFYRSKKEAWKYYWVSKAGLAARDDDDFYNYRRDVGVQLPSGRFGGIGVKEEVK